MTWLKHCNKFSNVNSWVSGICEKGCLYCYCCCILSPVEHSRTHCQAPFVLTPCQLGGNSLASSNGAWKKTSLVLLFFHLPSLFPIPGPLSPILLSILILENLLFFFLYCLGISSQVIPTSHFLWLSSLQLFGSTCLPSSAQLLLSLPGCSLLASFCLTGSHFSSEAWPWGVFCAPWGIWTVTFWDLGPWVPS